MRLAAFLLAACALLAPAAAMAQQAQETPPATAPGLNPLSGLDLDGLDATRSLPLFTPSRTPPVAPEPPPVVVAEPAPPPPPPPPPSPPQLDLVGVIATQSAKMALFRDRGTSEIVRLNAGDDYQGWSLSFVDSRTVEFRNGDQVQTLKLFNDFQAPGQGTPGEGPPGFLGAPPTGFLGNGQSGGQQDGKGGSSRRIPPPCRSRPQLVARSTSSIDVRPARNLAMPSSSMVVMPCALAAPRSRLRRRGRGSGCGASSSSRSTSKTPTRPR